MQNRSFEEFVDDLTKRRAVMDDGEEDPPVVLLGAGVSAGAGLPTMDGLQEIFEFTDRKQLVDFIAKHDEAERYRQLKAHLQRKEPEVSPGYRALAKLIASKYFDIILSLNFDSLLDDALASARMRRQNYLLVINGSIRPDWFNRVIFESSPRVKVIKLHGDLFHRCMAWTEREMEKWVAEIEPPLRQLLSSRDIVIMGASLTDVHIQKLVLEAGRERGRTIWYLHRWKGKVPDYLVGEKRVRAVDIGEGKGYEEFFPELLSAIEKEPPQQREKREPEPSKPLPSDTTLVSDWNVNLAWPENVPVPQFPSLRIITSSAEAQTIDDLLASVVAIENPESRRICTGFIITEPRVIITDGFVQKTQFIGKDKVRIIPSEGLAFDTRVMSPIDVDPSAPLMLQVPEGLERHGLRLSTEPLKPQLRVHVAVAAPSGNRIGISTGTICSDKETPHIIEPIGEVDHLVAVDCALVEGSSLGAPVVDDDHFAVHGFIVDGRGRLPSYMYPVYRWDHLIRKLK